MSLDLEGHCLTQEAIYPIKILFATGLLYRPSVPAVYEVLVHVRLFRWVNSSFGYLEFVSGGKLRAGPSRVQAFVTICGIHHDLVETNNMVVFNWTFELKAKPKIVWLSITDTKQKFFLLIKQLTFFYFWTIVTFELSLIIISKGNKVYIKNLLSHNFTKMYTDI